MPKGAPARTILQVSVERRRPCGEVSHGPVLEATKRAGLVGPVDATADGRLTRPETIARPHATDGCPDVSRETNDLGDL
jgi:hypothetical protein